MPEEKRSENSSEENLFDKMASLPPEPPFKKLQRSANNAIIAGVCSGIAEYWRLDAGTVRLVALLSLLLGGWSIVAYLITAILLPVGKSSMELSSIERSAQQKENFKTIISGLFIFTGLHFAFIYIGIASGERIFIFPSGFVFPIAALVAGIFLMTKRNDLNGGGDHLYSENYYRSRSDRKIMGVCGGLGNYLKVDSSVLRIIFILAALLTFGMFALIYPFLSLFTHLETERKFE